MVNCYNRDVDTFFPLPVGHILTLKVYSFAKISNLYLSSLKLSFLSLYHYSCLHWKKRLP